MDTPRTELRHNRAFVLLTAATAVRGIAFWLCWLGMLSFASFTLEATAGQIALVTAATSLPHIFLSPFLGTLVDRIHPKHALIGAFIWNVGIGVALLLVTAVWQTYLIAIAWSASGAVVWPAIGSLLKQIVPARDLNRANGTLHGTWEATLIVGPLASGLLSDHVGPSASVAAGAAISVLSIIVLLPLRADVVRAGKALPGRRIAELQQGLSLMMRLPDLRALALWGAGAWAGFSVLIAIEPVFVRDFLGGSESMLSAMYSVGGIGATIGALAFGRFAFSRFELRTAAVGLAMAGSLFAVYIAIGRWPHVLAIQAFIGMGFAVYQTASQTLIQRRAPQEVVGRGLAAKRQIEEVAGLVGSVAAGGLAAAVGTRETMIGAGVLMTLSAAVLFVRSLSLPPAPDREEQEAGAAPAIEQTGVGLDPAHDRASSLGAE